MDRLEFLTHRAAFSGLPFGEWHAALAALRQGWEWLDCFRQAAQRLRGLAHRAEVAGRFVAAAQAWQWVACAYQTATFALHFEPETSAGLRTLSRLRYLARFAYLRALKLDPCLGRPVTIAAGAVTIHGYLRLPARPTMPLVVLLNGLDSVCEVELHAFGTWLHSRGFGTLALDLPAALTARPRTPCFAVERLAPAVADWAAQQPGLASRPLGAFGVSFGGHLVARLLAGDPRFTAGVAVSPAARLGRQELQAPRIRRMFAWTFDLADEAALLHKAGSIHLDQLPSPSGRLLLYQMDRDHLFGPEHAEGLLAWGRDRVEVRRLCAEHVGTSLIHHWLPEACDWLGGQLSPAERRPELWAFGQPC